MYIQPIAMPNSPAPIRAVRSPPDTSASAEGPGPIRYPLTFNSPDTELSRHYVGLDLASTRATLEAIELARDRGEPALTSPLDFSLDKSPAEVAGDLASRPTTATPRLLVFAPFFRDGRPTGIAERRQQIAGMVVIGIDVTLIVEELSAGKIAIASLSTFDPSSARRPRQPTRRR